MYIGIGIEELQEPVQQIDRKPLSSKVLQDNSDALNADALMKLIDNSELDSITTGISQESEVESKVESNVGSKVESKVDSDLNINDDEKHDLDQVPTQLLNEPKKSVNLVSRIAQCMRTFKKLT